MPGGDSGPDGEEPAVPSTTGEHGGEARGASGGEAGQEDEEMTSGSHDLSSSTNHSPGSAMGSTSASTKRYLSDWVCPDCAAPTSLDLSQNEF